ncbi:MAG TPA: hypothetical protein VGP63_07595 [Planctomycetaceae bacterium]|nr:hypothetical protein [Planctomycetaceae bacterium]
MLRDPFGPPFFLELQIQDQEPNSDLRFVLGFDLHVTSRLADPSAGRKFFDFVATCVDQDPHKPQRWATTNPEPTLGEFTLRRDDPLREGTQELAALVIVEHERDVVAQFAFAWFDGINGSSGQDNRDSICAKSLFEVRDLE